MSLKEKVESLYVAVCGNRVTLASEMLAANYCVAEIVKRDLSSDSVYYLLSSSVGFALAEIGLILTSFGAETYREFKKSIRRIDDGKSLDSNYFEERISFGINGNLFGYCRLQGLYLAAKKTGHLDAFYEAREKVSNCRIPNF